jgi:hypothetical protein
MSFRTLYEHYLHIGFLPERDRIKCELILRYEEKVSARLLKERDVFLERGRKLLEEELKRQFALGSSPFEMMAAVPKEDSWVGCYVPVRLKY